MWPRISMKLLEYPKVLGLKVLFPLGPPCYQWWVGTNSLKYGWKKSMVAVEIEPRTFGEAFFYQNRKTMAPPLFTFLQLVYLLSIMPEWCMIVEGRHMREHEGTLRALVSLLRRRLVHNLSLLAQLRTIFFLFNTRQDWLKIRIYAFSVNE